MPNEAIIKRIYDLPKIPQVVKNLIENLDAKATDAEKVSKDIQTDPVISAKVLRLANSARYGAGRKIASLDTAIVLLGTDALKTLVVASAVVSTMRDIPGIDMRDFWRHSFMIANLCKQIARGVNSCDPEIAFSCGMLHNIGIPLLCLTYSDKVQEVERRIEAGANRISVEQDLFGVDNLEICAYLARSWKFPDVISNALANQESKTNAADFSAYAGVIQLANFIQAKLVENIELKEVFNDLPHELCTYLGLDTFKLFEDIEKLLNSEDDIDSMLAA